MSHETYVIKPTAHPVGGLLYIVGSFTLLVLLSIFALNQTARADSPPIDMVVFGDSLVAGYGLSPGESFPEQLQKAVDEKGMRIKVENAGVSGDTTTGGLARLDWSIQDGTDLVLIELGANDALRGISPHLTRQNLDEMINRLKERGIGVMLAGMLAPPNMGNDYEVEFNPIYADLADKHAVPLYPFFLEGVAADPSLNQADGMHPTADGIAIIVENFLPFLKNNLPGQ